MEYREGKLVQLLEKGENSMTTKTYEAGKSVIEQHLPIEHGRDSNQERDLLTIQNNNLGIQLPPGSFPSKVPGVTIDKTAFSHSKRFIKVRHMLQSLLNRFKDMRRQFVSSREHFSYTEQRRFELENEKNRNLPHLLMSQTFYPN